MRVCSACGVGKPETAEFFHPHKGGRLGLRAECRGCKNAKTRERIKRPEIKAARAAYAKSEKGREIGRALCRKWASSNPDKLRAIRLKSREKTRIYQQSWRDRNREKVREKQRRADRKRARDPAYILKQRIKCRLREMALGKPNARTETIMGYTMEALRVHIERQFSAGMTWDAFRAGEIHIDHIRPLKSFSFSSADDPEFKACWAMTNLRPMWAIDNQRKGARMETLL